MLSPRLGRNSTATQFGRAPFHFNRIIMNNMFLNAKEWCLQILQHPSTTVDWDSETDRSVYNVILCFKYWLPGMRILNLQPQPISDLICLL